MTIGEVRTTKSSLSLNLTRGALLTNPELERWLELKIIHNTFNYNNKLNNSLNCQYFLTL